MASGRSLRRRRRSGPRRSTRPRAGAPSWARRRDAARSYPAWWRACRQRRGAAAGALRSSRGPRASRRMLQRRRPRSPTRTADAADAARRCAAAAAAAKARRPRPHPPSPGLGKAPLGPSQGATHLRGADLLRVSFGAALLVLLCLQPGLVRAEQPLRGWVEWQVDKLLDSASLSTLEGDMAAALQATQRATGLSPDHAEAWATRAQLLASMLPPGGGSDAGAPDGPGRAAETAWTRWSTLAPSSHAAQLVGFQVALDTGRLETAAERLEPLLEGTPTADQPHPEQVQHVLDRPLARAELAAQRGDWGALSSALRAAQGADESLDLSPLPLQRRWRRFASNPEFIKVLNSVLEAP